MSEQEPSMGLNFGETRFEATPHNTSLFRFMGSLAMYNHVFLVTNEEEGKGTYLFSLHPAYPRMEEYMVENKYPIHDNLRRVSEIDSNTFDRMLSQHAQVPDSVPDDWQ